MARNPRQPAGTTVEDIDTPIAQLVAKPGAIALQTIGRLQSESMGFLAARVGKDIAFTRQCATCTSPADAIGFGAAYAMETADDYLREGFKFFAIVAGIFESGAAALI
jgi:hypothetical protein